MVLTACGRNETVVPKAANKPIMVTKFIYMGFLRSEVLKMAEATR